MATKPTETWLAVDAYFGERLLGTDPGLDAALAANRSAGLPDIGVAPNQGALLNILARSVGALSPLAFCDRRISAVSKEPKREASGEGWLILATASPA